MADTNKETEVGKGLLAVVKYLFVDVILAVRFFNKKNQNKPTQAEISAAEEATAESLLAVTTDPYTKIVFTKEGRNALATWTLNRLREKSTWIGLITLITSCVGFTVDPTKENIIAIVGSAAAAIGLTLIATPTLGATIIDPNKATKVIGIPPETDQQTDKPNN